MAVIKPRGTNDFIGQDALLMQKIEEIVRDVCKSFNIAEIRTPTFEYTELFARGVGETTDIVQKEMFTFEDRGGRSITLKPEGTAGAARAYVENSLYAVPQPTKLFYITSCFRNERPQAGRYKEFHQFGIEFYGSSSAYADAEVIAVENEILRRLGIEDVTLMINSLGGNECRKKYNEVLKGYIGDRLDQMCPDCQSRFEKNPLRVLDCKSEKCQSIIGDAPSVLDVLDDVCRAHFEALKASLDTMGIKYEVNPKIVRGLDYYTRTVFEFVSNSIGAQGTVCAGGRYDNLVKECGGPDTGAVGFAMGIERIMLLLKGLGLDKKLIGDSAVMLYIGSIGEKGQMEAQRLGYQLRQRGISVEYDVVGRSVKAQMKYADKLGAKYNIVLGDSEIETGIVKLKNMLDGEQSEIRLDNLYDELVRRM